MDLSTCDFADCAISPETQDHTRASRAISDLDTIYRRYRSPLVHMLKRRIGNEDDADDLAQEAFLRIIRYAGCDAESLRLLLFRIASNLAVSHGRWMRVRSHVPLDAVELISDAPSPDVRIAEEQFAAQLGAAVQQLPARCREVFTMSQRDELSTQDIATRCGISVRMVEKHMSRAHKIIREKILLAA